MMDGRREEPTGMPLQAVTGCGRTQRLGAASPAPTNCAAAQRIANQKGFGKFTDDRLEAAEEFVEFIGGIEVSFQFAGG